MKKLFALLLAVMMVMSALVFASAEEAPTVAEAWLLYFASNHEKDSANFPWWPQHQSVNQPASETGVEYTNAMVTGPGKYTVGLKFNWQKAEGAIQFNLIINNAEVLFPGYYVDITDIRVNGASIPLNENYYGTYHDDTKSGMVPLYNSYWDPFFTPDAQGPQNYRAFDGTPEDATHMVINPDDIVNGDSIEVDFIFAETAGAAPEELGAKPAAAFHLQKPAADDTEENATTAYLFWQDEDWWPATTNQDDDYWDMQTATITGEGHYTVGLKAHMPQWFFDQGFHNTGAQKLAIVIDDGSVLHPGMYLHITDVRVNGVSLEVGDVTYGTTGYSNVASDTGYVYWDEKDSYALLYDSYMANPENNGSIWDGRTWDSSAAAQDFNIFDVSQLNDPDSIEIDFFLSNAQDIVPVKAETNTTMTWFPRNTVGVAGLSLKDLGIADDWHNIVPVDTSKTGYHVFTLVGADAHMIGTAFVAVNNGAVTVTCDYVNSQVIEHSQCIKWFTSLDEITAEALTSIEGGFACGEAVNLEGICYLSINNKVTWSSPLTTDGTTLPRYWRNSPEWVSYRESLKTLLPAE